MVVRRSHALAWRRPDRCRSIDPNIGGAAFCFPALGINHSFDSMIQSAIPVSVAARPLGFAVLADTWRAPSSDAVVGRPSTESQRLTTRAGSRRDTVAR
jgi:hypothetical protein